MIQTIEASPRTLPLNRAWPGVARLSTLVDGLLPGLLAGTISGTLIVAFGVSLAAVIFTGPLAGHLPAGIGILLASSCVLGAVVSLRSSFKPVIAAPQENTSIVLALIAATVVEKVRAPSSAFPTVVVAMALSAIATGALFLALGKLRLGKLVRFIPYPVVGGFLAGSGLLLAQGSLSVMTGASIDVHTIGLLFTPSALLRWIPGLVFGALLAYATRRSRHFLILPGVLVAGIAAFYGVVFASGLGVAGASAGGWLLGPFPEGGLFQPPGLDTVARVDFSALRASAGGMVSVSVLAGVSFLLNATGLERATGAELDLDRELRANGVANLVSGALGGVPGYLSLSESAMNHKAGARGRVAGLLSAAICAACALAGASAIGYFPKPILGGLLFFFGLSFLLDTVYDAYFRLPRGEYALVLLILAVIAVADFMVGIGFGIVVSSVLFAINYARVDIVKRSASGAVLHSKASRSRGDEAALERFGDRLQILQLQGYVFFGTAFNLIEQIRRRLSARDRTRVELLILDFRHVDGVDSSAVASFSRLRAIAEEAGVTLVFTALPPWVRRSLVRGGVIDRDAAERAHDESPGHLVLTDLDRGLEWCEDRLLVEHAGPPSEAPGDLAEASRRQSLLDAVAGYFERIEAPVGHVVYREGDASSDLYLIERGELDAWIQAGDGREMRLRALGPGDVVGEEGLYLGGARSASVRATRRSVLHRLSPRALARMTREAPRLAAEFQRLVATLLAARLVSTTSAPQSFFY